MGTGYHYQHSGDHGAIGLALLASGQHECLQHNKSRHATPSHSASNSMSSPSSQSAPRTPTTQTAPATPFGQTAAQQQAFPAQPPTYQSALANPPQYAYQPQQYAQQQQPAPQQQYAAPQPAQQQQTQQHYVLGMQQ